MPILHLHVSDPDATLDLRRHLVEEGFPASRRSPQELAVLFPGRPSIFAPAAELDLWQMNHGEVTVAVVGETRRRGASRPGVP